MFYVIKKENEEDRKLYKITEQKDIYAEVYAMIKMLDNENREKIPTKVYEFFKNNRNYKYEIHFNSLEELNTETVSKEAVSMMSLIYYSYLCNESEKNKISQILLKNKELIEKRKIEKYDVNKIFEQRKEKENNVITENSLTIVKKKKFFEKIFERIKNIFKRK